MNKTHLYFWLLIYFMIADIFMTMKTTKALFSHSAASSSNVFAAIATFPTQTPTPTPTGIANHVVISEVQIKGTGAHASEQDFIELYNPQSVNYDLNGHRLVKRDSNDTADSNIVVWQSSTLIPSHGFYLWASSDNSFAASISADISTSANIASNNSIGLRNGPKDTGTLLDALSWSNNPNALQEGTAFTPVPQDGQSMERKALPTSTASSMATGGTDEFKGNGFDSDNNSTDFVLRIVSQPQNSASPTESP